MPRFVLTFFIGMTALAADETLTYAINWPSGLSLGEARLDTKQAGTRLSFVMEAAMPSVPIKGEFLAAVSSKGCTEKIEKTYTFGPRKSTETTTIENGKATRQTKDGGSSTFDAGACPRDALAYIRHLRAELAAGRLPGPQKVLFGAQYEVRLQVAGVGSAEINGQKVETDRLMVTVKGPASETMFELQVARDPARTPVRAQLPFLMGTFAIEIVK